VVNTDHALDKSGGRPLDMLAPKTTVMKVVLVGEGGVGKTSITLRYTENRFDDNMRMTVGANFASKKVTVGNTPITLMLWDLGGQPRFHDVIQDYFRGAKFGIGVYDVNRVYTLERLAEWLNRLKGVAPDCDLLVVGNKADERTGNGGISLAEGIAFASKFGADCIEVSAKTGEGISEIFDTAARMLLQKHLPRA